MAFVYSRPNPSYVHFMDVQGLLDLTDVMKLLAACEFLKRQKSMTEYLEQYLGPVGLDWRWTGKGHAYRFKGFDVYSGIYIYDEQTRLAFRLKFGV